MKFLKIAAIVVFLLIAVGFFCVYQGWDQLNERVIVDSTKLVQIPLGTSPADSMQILVREGIIQHQIPARNHTEIRPALGPE